MAQDRIVGLIKRIQEGKFDASTLSRHDRRVAIQYLRLETNFTQNRIAQLLKISRRTVIRECSELNESNRAYLGDYEPSRILDFIIAEAMIQKERARHDKDGWLEWKITSEIADVLEKFGLIKGKNLPAIHIGDNISVQANIENNQTKLIVNNLSEEQKKKFREAVIASGLVPIKRQQITEQPARLGQ